MNAIDFLQILASRNSWLLVASSFICLHFIVSYLRDAYQYGFKVDFWHSTLLLEFILPLIIMYPFASADGNVTAVGTRLSAIKDHVDDAFLFTCVGYVSTYFGFYLFDHGGERSFGALLDRLLGPLARSTEQFICSSICVSLNGWLALLSSLTLLGVYVHERGFGFDVRGFTHGDDNLRPYFNFIMHTYAPFIASLALIRYTMTRKLGALFLAVAIFLVLLPSGSRGTALGALTAPVIIILTLKRRTVSLPALSLSGLVLLCVLLYGGAVRDGHTSVVESLETIGPSIAYGNTFSDVRDFAWILSCWDGSLLYGKSYLAAFMAIVPRSVSEYRQEWSISIYTSHLIGFDPKTHAGLRPGKFGEAYLNFGIGGVIVMGLLGGVIMRYIDRKIKIEALRRNPSVARAFSWTVWMQALSNLFITAAFWNFYVVLVILLSGMWIRTLQADYQRVPNLRAHNIGS
jgi:oligosaccharide repeat unit polymerase